MLHYFKIRSVWKKQTSLGLELSLEKLGDPPCQSMRITLKEVEKNLVDVIPHSFFWSLSLAVLCCLVVIPAHTNMGTHKHRHTRSNTATKPPHTTSAAYCTAWRTRTAAEREPIISGEMLQL